MENNTSFRNDFTSKLSENFDPKSVQTILMIFDFVSSHAIELIVSKIGKRSGMHLYPHKLRHTFCTMGIRSGMRIEEVQSLMGHTSPKTTLIYCVLNETQIRDEYQRCFN